MAVSIDRRPHARSALVLALIAATGIWMLIAVGCSAPETTAPAPKVAADEHDPAVWGTAYPAAYEQWLSTRDERPAGKSAYKRGFDGGVMFDKLSEYPFEAVLFKGWGFGIDYNEPRGHYYMLVDQQEADPARVKAGGGCLTCKSPYAQDLYAKDKAALFSATYADAVAMLPQGRHQLGVACIDCHDSATMALSTRRWTVDSAIEEVGLDKASMTQTDRRLIVCGQCHCTYSVMKDQGKSVDIDFPWEGATWGAITVEKIIANIEGQDARHEWVQATTGFKLGYIRHPDVEFFTAGSPHYTAGVTCNDCHMAPVETAEGSLANHNIMSPLKLDMAACRQCHMESADQMRAAVIAIQDASLTDFIETGYQVATVAKLFEIANKSLETTAGDSAYDQAAAHYRQAFYRLNYMAAENSVGFHNPAEGKRILADARTEADAADKGLRALLASKGVKAPAPVPLDLRSYLSDRGVKKLGFKRVQYIADPSGGAEKRWAASLDPLLK